MSHRTVSILAAAVVGLLGVAGSAHAAGPSDRELDRLADAAVELLPLGRIFDSVAAANPQWPVKDGKAVEASQLSCLRAELSSEGYRRTKRAAVSDYARRNPSRVADDLATVEGAAPLFGKLVMAGAEKKPGVTPESIVGAASAEQLLAMTRLVTDPDSTELRKLVGLGDAFNVTRSANENEKSGEQLGASLAMQAILQATITCKVPPGALL